MTYRSTNDSSIQSPFERSQEARRILVDFALASKTDNMTKSERRFVEDTYNRFELDEYTPISIKQLWWLRDIKDRYL